jgi:hypothetical protein
VRFGVIADRVSTIGNLADDFRTSAGELAHEEKACGRLIALQEGQELRRVGRVRPIIESERDLGRYRSVMERGAEKL